MEWSNVKRITVHFIKLLILLAILLWISSFFKPFDKEIGAVATTNKAGPAFLLKPAFNPVFLVTA